MNTDIVFTLAEILGFENSKFSNSQIFSGESLFKVKTIERIRIGYHSNYHIILSNSTHFLRIYKDVSLSLNDLQTNIIRQKRLFIGEI